VCPAVALSGLCPSPLHLRLSVPHASAVPASQAPGHMSDLSALMASSSSSSSRSSVACGRSSTAGGSTPAGLSHTAGVGALNLPGVCGPPWGLHMKVRCCWVRLGHCTKHQDVIGWLEVMCPMCTADPSMRGYAGHTTLFTEGGGS
jgi:hypothetical protein